jgi:hypothetical protein
MIPHQIITYLRVSPGRLMVKIPTGTEISKKKNKEKIER